ncbi:MAG: N-acetyl-alpha-D-glucosaminyl L-malate synthase BshA [Bacteroidia bacterium]|nr:N-acetyl-alpha-D-glucosaminyl L-malate synthase BshA [Bacteroidia bacterium]
MKIGIVCFPTYGGSGAVATELGIELASLGHKVHFISYELPFRLQHFHENIFFHEVNVSDYPLFEYPPYESVLASKIVDVAIYEELDLLHVHYAIPHASVAWMAQQILLSKKIRLPYITTLHGTDITLVGRDRSFEPIIRFSLNKSNAITTVSESLKRETLEAFKIDNKIHVIPNFIDTREYDRKHTRCIKSSLGIPNVPVLVHISNFRKVKRIDDVIKIFLHVRKEIPCKIILAGDGPERAMAEAMARNSEYRKDIIFLGHVPNPKELLCMADIFLLPSQTESFGLSALEALSMGVPVISSNRGGLPELNLHGKTGFLHKPGEVEQMAESVLYILNNKNTLQKFRDNARKQALKFDKNKIIPLYITLYKEIISQNKSKK